MDLNLTAANPAIKRYAATLAEIVAQGATNEGAVRDAFSQLLRDIGSRRDPKLTLLAEQSIQRRNGRIRVDGVLNDENRYPFGHWEAKDTRDDLETEITKKIARDYPLQNIIFEDTRRAVLYQNKRRVGSYDLASPAEVAQLLTLFFSHTEPAIEGFNQAVRIFSERVPEHAGNLRDIIQTAHRENKKFQDAFDLFVGIVRDALNPNLSESEVDEMLIQHLLTERIIREVFDMDHFAQSNVIAHEVEKVIAALTSRSFNRKEFLGQLDFFYTAVENAARTLPGFSEKQAFLNTVYERFFQGFAVKSADVLGIVYTPQEIVDFMGAAVEEVLVQDFGLSLADPAVTIIDPCTGTGNFVVNLLKRLDERHKPALRDVYQHRLFANEVALMPYYIASLNIEHAYRELTGEYLPFEGICLVDTLGLSESENMLPLFAEENTERIQRQQAAPITVIIGNPPYNVGQQNENDNNKNRKYKVIDQRVRETYVKDSVASSKSKLDDGYVKFWRWASDRLGDRDGIVAFVSNNGFLGGIAFDGMRKSLSRDFTHVYHINLKGNARTSGEQRRREGGNIFSDLIRVGVGITIAVRSNKHMEHKVFYAEVADYWKGSQKLNWLADHVERAGRHNALNTIKWLEVEPNKKGDWQIAANADEYAEQIPMGSKLGKSAKGFDLESTLFVNYCLGVTTARDSVVLGFDRKELSLRIKSFIDEYNGEVDRFRRHGAPKDIDNFVSYKRIKWSRDLKLDLARQVYVEFSDPKLRVASYRPFCTLHIFYDKVLNEETRSFNQIFPTPQSESENAAICTSGAGSEEFRVLLTHQIVEYKFSNATNGGTQCFPFYTYKADGSKRRENITDWALSQFHSNYNDPAITKWDIFYYTYAVLHHPEYRSRFKDALKKELPRIPFAPNFHAFATAGKALAALHLNYENVTPYPLTDLWTPGKPADYRVAKMRFNADKSSLVVNPSLTLSGFPPEAFAYKLGGRSALDWVAEQYQVKTDKRSGITSDPNRYSDDERYIVDLVKRVTTVSVETVKLVNALPPLFPPAQ